MKGKLKLAGNKKTWLLVREDGKELQVPTRVLTRVLFPLDSKKHDGLEVEYELDKGLPSKIYEVGMEWQPQSAPGYRGLHSQTDGAPRGGGGRPPFSDRGESRSHGRSEPQTSRPSLPGDFHNPYNFVPALPRDDERVKDSGLGDSQPVGHDRYHAELCSGRLRVKMTVATPLLLPDASRVKVTGEGKSEHKTYPVQVDAEGNPYIAVTAVKGMLRSAYEGITNSRLSVFRNHDQRLAFRMESTDGVMMVPARIEVSADGKDEITLYTGTTSITDTGAPSRGDAVCAAWLRYYPSPLTFFGTTSKPEHKDHVSVWLERFQHHRWDKGKRQHVPDFQYWKARKIVRYGDPLGTQPNQTLTGSKQDGCSFHQPLGLPLQEADGYVCITNRNFDRKHDERIFFNANKPTQIDLDERLKIEWDRLIEEYREIHREEIEQGAPSPSALKNSVWSRHIINRIEEESLLKGGTLCYARVKRLREGWQVNELYPVMISRRLHHHSPARILPASLGLATSLSELSPADRVFGWVAQEGKGAYRGQLRISVIDHAPQQNGQDYDAIERFAEPGVPLAILGQPKPQQGRFYVAADKAGGAQARGLNTEKAGYDELHKGLRGRKVYPHHNNLPDGYWDNAVEDRTQQSLAGYYREYRRPSKDGQDCDNQNRSVLGWIKPDTIFEFDIHFTNLSAIEIGALVWLLQLPNRAFHRFGGGKPLGFGSVRLDLISEKSEICTGAEFIKRYKALSEDEPNNCDAAELITAFKKTVWSAYGNDFREKEDNESSSDYQRVVDQGFNEVGFIAAFLRAARGFDDKLPIHYPRVTKKPNPDGESFKWFVQNASSTKDGVRHGYPLADLAHDQGLPILEERNRGAKG